MPMMQVATPGRACAADALEEITVTGSRIEREEFGDYQLYRLPWRTDLDGAPDEAGAVPRRARGRASSASTASGSTSLTEPPAEDVAIPNLDRCASRTREADGLGEPLPSGVVRVFEPYGGRDVFAGEAEVGDRPVGLPVELVIGRAQNVHARGHDGLEYGGPPQRGRGVVVTTEHRIVNNKAVPIDLEIRHGVEDYYDRTSTSKATLAADAPQVRRSRLALRRAARRGAAAATSCRRSSSSNARARSVARAPAEAQPKQLDVAVPPLLAARERRRCAAAASPGS